MNPGRKRFALSSQCNRSCAVVVGGDPGVKADVACWEVGGLCFVWDGGGCRIFGELRISPARVEGFFHSLAEKEELVESRRGAVSANERLTRFPSPLIKPD